MSTRNLGIPFWKIAELQIFHSAGKNGKRYFPKKRRAKLARVGKFCQHFAKKAEFALLYGKNHPRFTKCMANFARIEFFAGKNCPQEVWLCGQKLPAQNCAAGKNCPHSIMRGQKKPAFHNVRAKKARGALIHRINVDKFEIIHRKRLNLQILWHITICMMIR